MKRLVLLGGGYGNMRILLRLLPNNFPQDTKITLVDRTPFHSLKTEFYALAAGTTTDKNVRVNFPENERLETVYGEITKIDRKEKKVILEDGQFIPYDDLVIGLGCEDDYHGVLEQKKTVIVYKQLRNHVQPLKSFVDYHQALS